MANLFNFKISLFGFNKKEVETRINDINTVHEKRINEKEKENKELLDKYKEMEKMYHEAMQALGVCNEEKSAATGAVVVAMSDLTKTKANLAVSIEKEKMLKAQVTELKSQVDELNVKLEQLDELKAQKELLLAEKEKIAQAWIVSTERADAIIKDANEKAEKIVNDAIVFSEAEKKAVEVKIDAEREKLVDIKREMRDLRDSFVSMLHKYGEEIDDRIEDSSVESVNEDTVVVKSDIDAGIPDLPSDFGKLLRPDDEANSNVFSFSDYIEDDDTSVTVL